ncbi:ABC-three component system middle component 6 [Neisseria wadsworthii]|uniref:Uncharacterized protein n=1 Tax=Neisseria wadsworthii 9715 TaxID=1030841 RepID=G4CN26_9NEIS|nr:ABC-three component system middle component 6 [Neisseria wadsworthii]EGZ50778.1 hypothetical protein HMPREF9370_0485 [Neisseria wadsworthii 9715]QMT36480.1 hypothetical protein H3L96_04480 [Neisseria wadsworthii]
MALLHPESDLSLSVVAMGAGLLKILSKKSPVMIDDLLALFLKQDRRRTIVNFYSSLEFLYAVGAVEHEQYHISICRQPVQTDIFD